MWVDALGRRQPSGGATRATRRNSRPNSVHKCPKMAPRGHLRRSVYTPASSRPLARPGGATGPTTSTVPWPRDVRELGPEAHATGTVTQLPIHTSSRSLCFDPRFPPQPAPRSSNVRQTMLRSCKRWRSSREEPQVRAIVGSSVPYEDVGVRGKRQMFDLGTIKGKGVTRSVSLASLVMSLEIPAAVAEISLPLTGLLLA